jgi:hypothetical protein
MRALANPVERFAGDDVEIPRLGIHRRRRAHSETDDFFDQRPWHRIRLIPANTAAAHDNVVKQHNGSFNRRVCIGVGSGFWRGENPAR